MYKAFTLLALLLSAHNAFAIDSIEIGTQSTTNFSSQLTFSSPIKPALAAYLDLEDSLSEQDVVIFSKTNDIYRVSVQLETSMSISDEGPHLDLTDWKHCTTDWFPATAINQSIFKIPNLDKINTDCFPKVTDEEIKAEVFRQGGQSWVDVLEQDGFPEGYSPALIAVSMVRIKIEKQVNTAWQPVTTIHVSVPLGC